MLSDSDSQLVMAAARIRDDDAEAARIGQDLALLFRLRRDPEHKDRWKTAWGTKTDIGLSRTVLAFLEGAVK